MNCIPRRSGRRGITLLGMATIVLVTSALSAMALMSSAQLYRNSAQSQYRLQALAASEGAVAAILHGRGLPAEELHIGPCIILPPEAAVPPSGDLEVPVATRVLGRDGRVVFETTRHARLRIDVDGSWQFLAWKE